jgi:primosomal protein N' (replication factor Y)
LTSGRAGRRAGDAEVIFQTYTPAHYAIHAAARYDSEMFYTQELLYRKKMQYPPYTRFIKLVWTHRDRISAEQWHATRWIDTAPRRRVW